MILIIYFKIIIHILMDDVMFFNQENLTSFFMVLYII